MVALYVESGGDRAALRAAYRESFATFITKAGVKNRPRIVACGSRSDAYEGFCTTIAQGKPAMLLVDSETAVAAAHQTGTPDQWRPWAHLRQQDKWNKPKGSSDTDCHMMVVTMESLFLADRKTLQVFFGPEFNIKAPPATENLLENADKSVVYSALQQATDSCKTKSCFAENCRAASLLMVWRAFGC